MLQISGRLLAGTALSALPLLVIAGCGGGSGGGSALPTSTPGPTSTPRPTTTPTTPPDTSGQSYSLIATFSNIKGSGIPSSFLSNKGEGSFRSNGFFGASFKKAGAEGFLLNLTLSMGTDTIEEGEPIVLPDGRGVIQLPKSLIYFNPVTQDRFISKSGTVQFLKITPVTGPKGQSLTRVKFNLTNVVMVPVNEGDDTFTVNATGETVSPLTTSGE